MAPNNPQPATAHLKVQVDMQPEQLCLIVGGNRFDLGPEASLDLAVNLTRWAAGYILAHRPPKDLYLPRR